MSSRRWSYDRVDLLPLSQLMIGPLRFGGTTVPGMRLDGERLVGSRAIMRRLDELFPEPPLLPTSDEQLRARVLEAEQWGDEIFQSVPRRLIFAALLRRPEAMETYVTDDRLPVPTAWMRPAMPLTGRLLALRYKATDEAARESLLALPRQLAQIDDWIADGILGAERPNAADLQIGSTIRLLRSVGDVRAMIDARPAARLARYFPPLPGAIEPGVLPARGCLP